MNDYKAPNARSYPLFDEIALEHHTLIAGCTGSGKSVFENGLLFSILNRYTPAEAAVYLIDPKMVALFKWRCMPHVAGYADNAEELEALRRVWFAQMFGKIKASSSTL